MQEGGEVVRRLQKGGRPACRGLPKGPQGETRPDRAPHPGLRQGGLNMPRSKEGYKVYKAGDPIHIVVTQEFADVANEFFSYCKEKGYNPSEVIRQAIVEWYR